MVTVQMRNSDRAVMAWGTLLAPPPAGYSYVELSDTLIPQLLGATIDYVSADGKSLTSAPVPAPPVQSPPPDIAGIITALTSSPSIDQPTKNALIAALKGQ